MAVIEQLEGAGIAVLHERHEVLVRKCSYLLAVLHVSGLRAEAPDRISDNSRPMPKRNPAQFYALVFGSALLAVGVLGFFYSASFETNAAVPHDESVLGILDVNGWHNVVHILTGLAGLASAASYSGARIYALVLGATYLLVAVWGFVIGTEEAILGLVPVNTEDNVLHLLIALAGLGAYAATPAVPPPTTVASEG